MKTITINLPDDVVHRLEVAAAIDGLRLPAGIEKLLTYLANQFDARRQAKKSDAVGEV